MIKLEKTNKFYEEIKTMNFFKRLFSWGKIISLLVESDREIREIQKVVDKNSKLSSDINVKDEKINSLKERLGKSENKNRELEWDVKKLNQENKNSAEKIAGFESVKEGQQKEYDTRIARLEKREETLEKRRQDIEDGQVEKEKQKFEEMKKTWNAHEDVVEQSIKQICNKYAVEYVDKEKVPFKGKPDNSIKIANEFIIFDAKSPYKEDLRNFPNYVKNQAEAVKKYVKEADVKKDVFLVVPTNTIQSLETTFYDMSDYRVYIVATDSLEPIILSFRKIEEYEFAEKLSPEDREQICRIIGHFAHHTKRRLQIDNFLINKSLDLLKDCENLPEDVLENVKNHEVKSKLNVPIEKRFEKAIRCKKINR